jgi:hypothetical protein
MNPDDHGLKPWTTPNLSFLNCMSQVFVAMTRKSDGYIYCILERNDGIAHPSSVFPDF